MEVIREENLMLFRIILDIFILKIIIIIIIHIAKYRSLCKIFTNLTC